MFVSLMEICGVIIVVYLVISQMIVPAIRGTKLFPMIRREQKLNDKIVDLNQKVVEKGLEEKIETIKKEKGVN